MEFSTFFDGFPNILLLLIQYIKGLELFVMERFWYFTVPISKSTPIVINMTSTIFRAKFHIQDNYSFQTSKQEQDQRGHDESDLGL